MQNDFIFLGLFTANWYTVKCLLFMHIFPRNVFIANGSVNIQSYINVLDKRSAYYRVAHKRKWITIRWKKGAYIFYYKIVQKITKIYILFKLCGSRMPRLSNFQDEVMVLFQKEQPNSGLKISKTFCQSSLVWATHATSVFLSCLELLNFYPSRFFQINVTTFLTIK